MCICIALLTGIWHNHCFMYYNCILEHSSYEFSKFKEKTGLKVKLAKTWKDLVRCLWKLHNVLLLGVKSLAEQQTVIIKVYNWVWTIFLFKLLVLCVNNIETTAEQVTWTKLHIQQNSNNTHIVIELSKGYLM